MSPIPPPTSRRVALLPSTPLGRGLLILGALALLGCAAASSVAVGARSVPWQEIQAALFAPDPGNIDHAAVAARLPRTLAGLLCGAALGMGGALMQGATRNPLADPGILGINSGAAFAVVAGITWADLSPSHPASLWLALLGSAAAAVVVYGATRGGNGLTGARLALVGAAVAAGLGALVSGMLLTSSLALDQFRFWQVGSLGGRGFDTLLAAWPFLLVGSVAALAVARSLNILALGDQVATALGQRTEVVRALAGLAVVLLCAPATATVGPVAFVGLMVPHLVRPLAGGDYRWTVPLSAAGGAIALLTADVLGRLAGAPGEIPAGVMTALVGAPVFVVLVRRGGVGRSAS